MLKRAMLALTFVGALVIGSLGLTSSAQAYHGHCGGGGGGYYGGGYYPTYRTSYYGGYAPRYSAYEHRFGGHRHRHRDHHHDAYDAPRSGVSFYFGF